MEMYKMIDHPPPYINGNPLTITDLNRTSIIEYAMDKLFPFFLFLIEGLLIDKRMPIVEIPVGLCIMSSSS